MSVEIYRRAPALAAAYRDQLPGFGAAPGLRDWAAGYAADHAGRCLWDARFLLRHGRTGRLLNIGGAPYLFEFALKHENPAAEIVSVDLDPERFPHVEAALGIRVVAGNIESGGWEAGGLFDCIVLAEVFEHLRIDLLGTLAGIRNHLSRDGLLYLTTPNGLSLWALCGRFMRGRTGPPLVSEWEKLRRIGHMGHVREYSALEVTETLASCGFVIEKSMFRAPKGDKWPLRDLLVPLRPSLAEEVVVLARKHDP